MVYFIHIFMVAFLVIQTSRILLILDLDYDDLLYRLFSEPQSKFFNPKAIARISGVEGLNDTVFDECILRSNPTWTEEMRRLLNPAYDPLKNCDRSYRPWSSLDADGRILIRREFSDAECRARALLLKDDHSNAPGEWHAVKEKVVFENDIVEVDCTRGGKVVYKFIHSQIWSGEKRNFRISPPEQSEAINDNPPSVYIMIMDSFGASHAKRVFPKTLKFLKDEFQSIEMDHLNKVGENSRPNAFPFLFGKRV
ncbi:hypothetical protein PMAYCL1PPCAC_11578, partial [Pristionchus mayeri]